MMELTCAFLLVSASLVLATPHGYGVKGGASARADSSASSGAYGGIPVPLPLGGSYSGSFSKSSSSSSSSSSASSSSSSSSFTYNGSGGYGLNGGAQGNGGCAGSCQNTGDNSVPATHGSSGQGYGSNNAAATTDSEAVSGSRCQGTTCNDDSEKCTSGQCKPKSQTGTTSIDSDNQKCTSGQCGSSLNNGPSSSESGSNDIHVVTHSSDSAHDAKDQSSATDKPSSPYNGVDCSQGKCGPSGPSNSNLNHHGYSSENTYQGSSASNKQHASNFETGATSPYQKPSTHLETPKLDSTCTSGKCNAEPSETGYATSPSSYNVAIHGDGVYSNGERKPPCDGVKCENQPKGTYSPTDNSVTKAPTFDAFTSTNCGGSICFPANPINSGPSFTIKPGSINFGQSPSNGPSLTVFSCNTPNCTPYPTNSGVTPGPIAPGHIDHGTSNDINKPSNNKGPGYTGGFGGPTGVLNPNEFNVAAPTGTPSYGHASTSQDGKPLGSVPTGCNSPSCNYPSTSGPSGPTGTYNHKPSSELPNEKLPTYSGGFGGPAGMLKPNEFGIHTAAASKPNYAQPGSSSYNTQPNNYGPTGCKSGNCGGYSPAAGTISGVTAPSGHYASTKPSTGESAPSEKLPPYTGGFGGPGGVLFNPNAQPTGPSTPDQTPSGPYTPSASGRPGGCKTPNCLPSAAANAQTESFGITNPGTSPHLSSVTLPSYSSSYHRPSGIHKPNEGSAPASTPGFVYTQPQSSPGSYSSGCKTGSCGTYANSGPSLDSNTYPGSVDTTKPITNGVIPSHPHYTAGTSGPTGPLKPNEPTYFTPVTGGTPTNCGTPNCSPSSIDVTSAANAQTGSFGIPKPSLPNSDKKPTYTGGFGGASGLLKPSEYTIPAANPTLNDHNKPTPTASACTSGSCIPQVSHGSASHSHNTASSGAHAAAAAEANAVAYTGGFGGPPGVLIPYDDGKASPNDGGKSHASQISGTHYSSHNTHLQHGTLPGGSSTPTGVTGPSGEQENTGAQVGSVAGSVAHAGAVAGSFTGAHGYNTHGHYNHAGNIKGSSPCGGGCGGTSGGAYNGGSNYDISGSHGFPKHGYSDGLSGAGSTSGSAARSLAGASAFGASGSYAGSSASAHASAGSYTKGSYGKR